MIIISRKRTGFAQTFLQALGGVLEGHGVHFLVPLPLKVEVVNDGSQLGLLSGVAVNRDLELAPALVLTREGGFCEAW